MGKAQKKKGRQRAAARWNPLGQAAAPATTSLSAPLPPILSQLKSVKEDDRAWAAAALSNLVLDPGARAQLLSANVIELLCERLGDPKLEIAMEVAGALRNLAVVGGDSVCHDLISKGIMEILARLAVKVMTLLDPPAEPMEVSPEMAPKAAFSFGEQIAALMWCLIEVSDAAMTRAVQGIPFLVQLFSHSEAPFSTREAAGQCLLTLTEEFPEAQAQVPSEMLQALIGRPEEETIPMALRVLASGILANTIQDETSPFLPQVMETVNRCIAQDWSQVLQKATDLSSKIELESSKGDQQLAEGTSNATGGIDLDAIKKSIDGKHAALQALESQTRYLQLSLEILSNIFCEEGLASGEQDWEDADEDLDKDLDMDVDPSDGMTLDEEDTSLQVDSPCLSLLGPGLFASLTSLLSLSSPSGPALETLIAEWATVKERTLGSLTNILSSGSPSFWATKLSNSDKAHRLWATLFSAGSPESLASHIETLWAMSRILPTNSIQPTMEQTQSLIHIFQHASTLSSEDVSASDIQTASVGVLGYMGRTQGCVSLNEMIGSFLVAQVETLVDIDTLAETLNALFDMYSDAEFDYDTPVYRSLGFNARLKALQGSVQSRVKALDKRTQGPTRARGEEALQNLKAFVSYKESEAGARSPSR